MIKIDACNKRVISNKEYFSMLSVSVFTTEFIFLPWILVTLGGIRGIFSLVLLTIIRLVIWIIVSNILMSYPGCSMLDIVDKKYGRLVGVITKFIYVIYLLFVQVAMLITVYSIISSYTLMATPKYLIIGIILMAIFYTVQRGIYSLFKISKLVLSMIIGIMLVMILLVAKVEYTNLFPIKDSSFNSLIYTTFIMTSFFSGLECSLIYSKFVDDTKSIKKVGILSIIFTQLILITFTLISCGVLGKEMIIKQRWSLFSTISLLDTTIVSKPEVVICFVSVFIILMSISIYAYTATYCINDIFTKNSKRNTLINLFTIIALFVSTMYVSNKYTIYEVLYYKQFYPVIIFIVILLCLLKNKRRTNRGEN